MTNPYRVLLFIVAYNAERTIQAVLQRIPVELASRYEVEVLVIDDASQDATFERGRAAGGTTDVPFPLHVLYNPENQGYGGNQKIGFHYALERGYDAVALIHGDGQYAPERLPALLEPLSSGEADVVMGSRMMMRGEARRGGMPLYKFLGNRVLSTLQNSILQTHLSEFHSGYRLYSTHALRAIPFDLNSNDFHFDTEIIIQMLRAQQRIVELPIPTYYGDEICHVNGLRYARDVLLASLKARVQEMDLVYDRKFDISEPGEESTRYRTKLGYDSSHSYALSAVPAGTRVLDLGCGDGRLAEALRARGCYVAGVDAHPLPPNVVLDEFWQHDLNEPLLPVDAAAFRYILALDIIEHLASPEAFVQGLREVVSTDPGVRLVFTTGNIAFVATRLLLLAGQFNYGKRGILDMTHTRLFTFSTLRRLLEGEGFRVELIRGVPAPFPEALGETTLARLLLRLNKLLIRVRPQVFSYQVFMVATPRPALEYLLQRAETASAARAAPLTRPLSQ